MFAHLSWRRGVGLGARLVIILALIPFLGIFAQKLTKGNWSLATTGASGAGAHSIYLPLTMVSGKVNVLKTALVPADASWKFLDNGSDQGDAWRQPGFNDSAWNSGPAQLGYGDGDEATVVNSGPATDKYMTTYFRHTFTVNDPSQIRMLDIDLLRDDGAVVYLNGTEVFRSNMPTGVITYTTPAASVVGGYVENTYYHQTVEPSYLVTGENLLAVEIHQDAPTSSDISFDLVLHATPVVGVVRFAAIGDFGLAGTPEQDVADLVKSWQPDMIITMGDNNYSAGAEASIDANIGQYYHEYIYPYTGNYGPGAKYNRFFPALGNHDWVTNAGTPPVPWPYLDYFSLPPGPGQERYYDFSWGPVHFFVVDSDPHEPDGVVSTSPQAEWLHSQLEGSFSPWKLVYFHHPPYSSSSSHPPTGDTRWPFADWGASLVMSGHDHTYERLNIDNFTYIVNGIGGAGLYPFGPPVEGSQVRYDSNYGAMLIQADDCTLTAQFIHRNKAVIDSFQLYNPAEQCK